MSNLQIYNYLNFYFIMKRISSIELKHIVDELKFIVGGKIEKIYHKDRELRLRIYIPKSVAHDIGEVELLIAPERIHLTQYKEVAVEPTSFCMFLRKYLKGKVIRDIRQVKLDRIVEIVFDKYILLCELFHHGNFILCDSNYAILMPLEFQRWKDREILPRKTYKPPSSIDPRNFAEFEYAAKQTELNIGSFLGNLFGATYSEEICSRVQVNKKERFTDETIKKIYKVIISLIEHERKPCVVFENNTPIDATPFPLLIYKDKKLKFFDFFNEALDILYYEKEKEEKKRIKEEIEKEIEEKKERIREIQKRTLEKYEKEEKKRRLKAELIYRNYGLVDSILTRLQEARKRMSWKEIKEIIAREDSPEANAIREIREHEGIVVVDLEGESVELYLNKSLEENAAMYYEEAKRAKEKKERTKKVLKKEIEKKIKEEIEEKGKVRAKKERKRRKRWFERFRWFITSDGFLVVLGKDAKSNEELVKKYARAGEDVVLHAEVKGGAFAVVKARIDGRYKPKDITPVAIKEAGQMAACYSKAWQLGLGSVRVYWVRPEQLTKQAPAGEYLEKGAFHVKGERNYLKKMPVRLTIGVKDGQVIAGPVEAVAKRTRYFVTVQPGNVQAYELAKQIKQKLLEKCMPEDKEWIRKIPENEIAKHIPGGKGEIFLG